MAVGNVSGQKLRCLKSIRGDGQLVRSWNWIASSTLELLGISRALFAFRRVLQIMKESLDFTPYHIVLATDSEVNVQRIANPIVIPALGDPWERRTIFEVSNIAKKMGVISTRVIRKCNPTDHLSRGTVSRCKAKLAMMLPRRTCGCCVLGRIWMVIGRGQCIFQRVYVRMRL